MGFTKEEKQGWRAIFKNIDKSGEQGREGRKDNTLTEQELVDYVNQNPDFGINEEQARELYQIMDVDKNGVVTFTEFLDGVKGRFDLGYSDSDEE